MTKSYGGRKGHCRRGRPITLDYASPPQATQWPDGRSRHTRQWLGCGNSIPRYVFPLLKTWWALLDVPKTSRDWKKDCGKPGCPNDRRGQGAHPWRRGDRMRAATSAHGTFPTCPGGPLMSVLLGRLPTVLRVP